MKIVAILGSPHGKDGATYEILNQVLMASENEGAKTETIVLSKKKILYCVGCGTCLMEGTCTIRDDVVSIQEKMIAADAVIFASPVYLGTVTGQMKVFMDRCLPIGHRPPLIGKYGLAITASAGIGDESTVLYMSNALRAFGASIVGTLCGIGVGPGMFEDQEVLYEHAQRLGRQLVTAVREKHQYNLTGEQLRDRAFFRDLFIRYQGLFKEDYEFFKEKGWLTLPTDDAKEVERIFEEGEQLETGVALALVREMFEKMPEAFDSEAAKGIEMELQFELQEGDETLIWHVVIKDQKCESGEGSVKKPSLILKCSAKDWIAMSEGKLSGTRAFLSGRLKTKGKIRLMSKFEKVFPTGE